jgi:hypothetical protein
MGERISDLRIVRGGTAGSVPASCRDKASQNIADVMVHAVSADIDFSRRRVPDAYADSGVSGGGATRLVGRP